MSSWTVELRGSSQHVYIPRALSGQFIRLLVYSFFKGITDVFLAVRSLSLATGDEEWGVRRQKTKRRGVRRQNKASKQATHFYDYQTNIPIEPASSLFAWNINTNRTTVLFRNLVVWPSGARRRNNSYHFKRALEPHAYTFPQPLYLCKRRQHVPEAPLFSRSNLRLRCRIKSMRHIVSVRPGI